MAVKNLRRVMRLSKTMLTTHTISLTWSQPRMVFTVKVPSVRGLDIRGESRSRCW